MLDRSQVDAFVSAALKAGHSPEELLALVGETAARISADEGHAEKYRALHERHTESVLELAKLESARRAIDEK